ncbi:recombinase family protein, partial [Bacteroides eggerthii]
NLSVYQSIIDMENSRVVIYARVSSTTDRQSTERQVSDLRMLAESRKYTRRKYQEQRKIQKEQFLQSVLNTVSPRV